MESTGCKRKLSRNLFSQSVVSLFFTGSFRVSNSSKVSSTCGRGMEGEEWKQEEYGTDGMKILQQIRKPAKERTIRRHTDCTRK